MTKLEEWSNIQIGLKDKETPNQNPLKQRSLKNKLNPIG